MNIARQRATAAAAHQIAAALPHSPVLKAFNTAFAGALTSGGLRAIGAGSLNRANELEALGVLQLTLPAAETLSRTGSFATIA